MGHNTEIRKTNTKGRDAYSEDFVLEKSIFNNVFEKDIRRVFIYKKAERLAKAIYLIVPAFVESVSLRSRVEVIAMSLVDAAILPSVSARTVLARELLALSSALSIARAGGLLSPMNVELIAREAQVLLQEIAAYEEPRLFLEEAPTLSTLAKKALSQEQQPESPSLPSESKKTTRRSPTVRTRRVKDKVDVSDNRIKDRQETIMSIIRNKGRASIKDISTHIRGVSEKTIQRELLALIEEGIVLKKGERRWSTYSLS